MNSLLLFFQDAGGASGIFGLLLPLLLMGGIFYFLVILPQKRQKQKLAEMVASLKINDEIVTNGGIIGRVKEVRETSFVIMSAEKSLLEIGKAAVVGKKAEE
ncbi:MAG TPA: preprotein translocase subunit YajC [Pyrinomonadaceae bacterium]|nr:preprotein translocase subunit YajC [Pyrinomonadaceae bacterium]